MYFKWPFWLQIRLSQRNFFNKMRISLFAAINVNVQDVDGCTALHLASAEDLEGRCVEYLLTHKADAVIRDHKVCYLVF